MTYDTIAIPVAFMICAALLLWFLIGSRGWWSVKAVFIACTLYFGLAVWHSVDSYMGWPTATSPPNKFQLYWAVVEAPDSANGKEGAIYMWMRGIDKISEITSEPQTVPVPGPDKYLKSLTYSGRKDIPRSYKLPYSPELHEQCKEAKKMLARGKPVIGQFKGDGKGFGSEGEGGNGKGKGFGDGLKQIGKGNGQGYGPGHRQSGEFIFYNLPPPKYPEKEHPCSRVL